MDAGYVGFLFGGGADGTTSADTDGGYFRAHVRAYYKQGALQAPVIVACLGDSITAGSPLWDPDPAVRARIDGPDERSQWQWWAARRDRELDFRNHGVYGQRTDEIAARLEEAARGADVLIVQGGINDVVQSRSVEEAARNLAGMVEHGRRLGLRVALADVLPVEQRRRPRRRTTSSGSTRSCARLPTG